MAGLTYNDLIPLTMMTCYSCAGIYAINEDFRRNRQQDGRHWHCPYCGRAMRYVVSDVQKLQKELEAERTRTAREQQRHDQTKAELRETERRRRGEKAAKTRAMNKIKKGVCPCCGKSFPNLMAHMGKEHPSYAVADAADGA